MKGTTMAHSDHPHYTAAERFERRAVKRRRTSITRRAALALAILEEA